MITGLTTFIAHIGYPTFTFKSPQIYNPWFDQAGVDTVVVPMACQKEDFAAFLPAVFRLQNLVGALITMPHKVAVCDLVDDMSPAARVAGACNAVRRMPDGRLLGDMFDGEGFVRGLRTKGQDPVGKRALVVGAGGVGSAIAASLAAAGVAELALFDVQPGAANALAARIRQHFPAVEVRTGRSDPEGFELVVNATPLGMKPGDPLPVDVDRLSPGTMVGEVVLSQEMTAFLQAAQAKGCTVQIGADMLFEQIPAYLEFFDLPSTDAATLRSLAQLDPAASATASAQAAASV
ncbi:shikimate dehydrogenase [Hydrogenophaga sp. 5NK40-0174]|uniref:shikimate dehydrogenase family protein n=1 Tax=Hydrogenophaga sp. 5NK40-0174 TaxID=3127649 RepID=UPI0031089004